MKQASNARKLKLHAGCVEVELRVEPAEAADQLLWREAVTTPPGAQIVLTEEGPWLQLPSFSTWPVLVQVPTRDGETLELRLGGVPQISPPPLKRQAPHIQQPARKSALEPQVVRVALAELRIYMHSFSSARDAPEATRDAIVARVSKEMSKVWELIQRVPDEERESLSAAFDELTSAMPAARQAALGPA